MILNDRFDKLNVREKTLVLVAIVVFSIFLFDISVFRPLAAKISRVKKEAAINAERLNYYKTTASQKSSTLSQYEQIRDLLGKASSVEEATSQMIGEIDNIAAKTGVLLVRRQTKDPRMLSFCHEHTLEISEFNAQFAQMAAFLYEIQRSPGMLRVTRLKFAPEKNSNLLKGYMEITKVVTPEAASF